MSPHDMISATIPIWLSFISLLLLFWSNSTTGRILQTSSSQLCEAWGQIISRKDIKIHLNLPDDPVSYRCFPYEIEIVLSNLITNSAAILRDIKSDNKNIIISLKDISNSIVIEYSDNGPGLASAYKPNPEMILEPFESSKTNELGELIGTGMGMWLIKRTISDYNGSIDLSQNTKESSGFFCKIKLPK